MHLNWLMPLGGDLTGTLPNPNVAPATFGSSILQAQVFGRRQIAQISLDDSQAIEVGQVFGKHALSWFPTPPDDSQLILANKTFTHMPGGPTGILPLMNGGTAKNLVAANGGMVYSDAASLEILAPTATANQMLRSGSNAAPNWSTDTWPDTTAINQILHATGSNQIGSRASFTFDGSTCQVAADNVTNPMTIAVSHTGTHGGTNGPAVFLATAAGVNGGDAQSTWTLTGLQSWSAGADVSASNHWKLSASTVLGTNDWISVDPATGAVVFGGTVNGITLSSLATGFSASGGTSSKTLTVDMTVAVSELFAFSAAQG